MTAAPTRETAGHGDTIAVADLGSNSFHLMVARVSGDDIQVIDRLREPIRLAAGLDSERHLQPAVAERALQCLQRFGQRIQEIPAQHVRAVGTNTLRKLRNGQDFMSQAEAALGHPIEIISGIEEARLVYGGITHGMSTEPRRLVVDIGGGSTELIIGRGAEPRLMESVSLGCVTHTQRFFADGIINANRFYRARTAAGVELEFLQRQYRKAGWDLAVGSSGSIRGVWRVIVAQGWSKQLITREALDQTIELLLSRRHISEIDFEDLREDRRPIFAGGLAVLAGIFDTLHIESMEASERNLREGLIYDLLGRLQLGGGDVRSQSVRAMARRYGVDPRHAEDMARTALAIFDQVADPWSLVPLWRQLLYWAVQLHEVGLTITHNGYHKHGDYILRHSDLQGFSQTEQKLLATLVRLHRGRFALDVLNELPVAWVEPIKRMAMILRLSYLLHRSRAPDTHPPIRVKTLRRGYEVSFDKAKWLTKRPLTRADLEYEADLLDRAHLQLKIS
ncbi:Ppx/GppA phosphatase family protein [Sinimarinibacterium sp. NLF-5-8]|uniref:Ppx/GppA phosphatase family protein n=1 Tax=Sinimarinibacterium sp. NLF-5-8 TaxID=2698684 RepID=UPI001EE4B9C8|nr:Ppx/GppA phosphatase family protein [Sinimarinibacterium sp. NLF-5-8]